MVHVSHDRKLVLSQLSTEWEEQSIIHKDTYGTPLYILYNTCIYMDKSNPLRLPPSLAHSQAASLNTRTFVGGACWKRG